MASSSVSQESLDFDDDFDTMARRNRIRTHRGRIMPHRSGEREGVGGDFHDRDGRERDQHYGDAGDGVDHDSPTRGAASRLKDKQRNRANHHKGKPGPKDKRKLREKRRSTGVVHLPSTESTGDSLDDDDDADNMNHETKKNTLFNESTASHAHGLHHHHHHHHHHHEPHTFQSRQPAGSFLPHGNKSPSDLEADLEDNQDYDSTVSHSETNLTLIGKAETPDTQKIPGLRSSYHPSTTYPKFSPEASRASSAPRFGLGSQAASSSEQDAKRPPPSTALPKSSVSALVSKYAFSTEPDSRVQHDAVSKDSGVSRVTGLGGPKDSWRSSERSYGSSLPSRIHEQEQESSEKGSNSNGSTSSAGGSYYTSRFNFQSARPFSTQQSATADSASQVQKQLDKEKEENKKLQQQLEVKDKRIAELERIVTMLNRECDDLDVDNVKLQEENKALIRAMQQLSSNM